jgi:regulatory protein
MRDADAAADPLARRRAAAAEALAAAERSAAEKPARSRPETLADRGVATADRRSADHTKGRARQGGRERGIGQPSRLPTPPDPAAEDREPDAEDVARAIVLKQLSMAPRSRKQLAEKLRQRGCADEIAVRVLDRMEAVGLVDDDAYADMMVRSKQATRGLAKRALAHELRGKGVPDATIADALGSIDSESERALAEDVARKTMRRLAGLEPEVQARRLAGVLSRKGYPPSVIYAVVRDAVNEAPEHRRD